MPYDPWERKFYAQQRSLEAQQRRNFEVYCKKRPHMKRTRGTVPRAALPYKRGKRRGERNEYGLLVRTPVRSRLSARERALLNVRTGGYLGIELKFLDCAFNDVVIAQGTSDSTGLELQPTSGCTDCISIPAQGDGSSNRDGRRWTVKGAWLHGLVEFTAATADTEALPAPAICILMVLDTQANATAISSEDVLNNPSSQPGGLFPTPARNLVNSKRFRILAKQYIAPAGMSSFNDAAGTGTQAPEGPYAVNLSWKGSLECEAIGSGASITVASGNAISILAFCSSAAFTPVFSGMSRVRFLG